LTGRMEN